MRACQSIKCIRTLPLYRKDLKEQHKVYLYIEEIFVHQNVLKSLQSEGLRREGMCVELSP